MNRLFLYLLSAIALLNASCSKEHVTDSSNNCPPVQTTAPNSEITALEDFILTNEINAAQDERGFFYVIEEEGNDLKPNACSNVMVDYEGRLTSGFIFDGANDFNFNLNQLITGWQAGLPLIGEGGKIILYLPPYFGYGNKSMNNIPPNSITIFTITLQKVNN